MNLFSSPSRLLKAFLLSLPLALAGGIQAAETSRDSARTTDEKLDAIHDDTRAIRRELTESPLGNRSWGVEINPLYVLFAGEGAGITGTVSNFSLNRSAELAFPFLIQSGDESSTFNLDAHYRHFLSGIQRGFYLAGFVRYQHATYQDLFDDSVERELDRGGLGFGIGYRIFSRSGLYWGVSLSAGRYLVGDKVRDDDVPNTLALWMGDLILDMELLKIGFAF